jgi:hypothetical protein
MLILIFKKNSEIRKSRVAVGITFEFIDRRQADNTLYTDPERRSSKDTGIESLFFGNAASKITGYAG